MSASAFEPIVLASPTLRVEILPFGLTVQSIQVAGQEVVPSYADPKSHGPPNRAFFGPIVGRYANRLPSGEVKFGPPSSVAHLLEFSAKGISHHGGPAPAHPSSGLLQHGPFDQCIWTPIPLSEGTLLLPSDAPERTVASALFALESPNGDQGYPGHVRVEVLVALTAPQASGRSKGGVHLLYRAKLLDDTPATPLNLTHHWGFNLSAASTLPAAIKEGGMIDQHTLQIRAPSVQLLGTDEQGLSTGQLLPIPQGSPHDLYHGGKALGTNMPVGGYDHFYFWGRPEGERAERVTLTAPSTGVEVTFATDQVGMQVYTTNGQPAYPAPSSETGGARTLALNHGDDRQRASQLGNHARCAAMIEFGAPHGTFLHPSLIEAAGTDTLLRNGQVYSAHTSAEFSAP